MPELALYPRYARMRLEEAVADTPVVLMHSPRQCGKTTLAGIVGRAAGYTYVTFDDDVQLAAARSDPLGFVADLPDRLYLMRYSACRIYSWGFVRQRDEVHSVMKSA